MMYETKLILNIWRYEPMTISNMKEKIDNLLSKEPSRWMEKALRDEANEAWLERSSNIALRILGALQLNGMSQKELAEKTGVSPQQVSKLLKGNENLTLETIAKLEAALGIVLIAIPESVSGREAELTTAHVQKKSTSRRSGSKTLLSFQQGREAGIVHETATGYGKEGKKKRKQQSRIKQL